MRVLLLLLSLALSLSCRADGALVEAISRQAAAVRTMEGHFTQQKFLGILPGPLLSSGKFSFDRGKGIVWQTLEPIESTLTLQPGVNNEPSATSSQDVHAEVVSHLFMQLLTGDFTHLEQLFQLRARGDTEHWSLELVPRSSQLESYIKAILISGGQYSEQIVIREKNGDRTDIRLHVDRVEKAPASGSS